MTGQGRSGALTVMAEMDREFTERVVAVVRRWGAQGATPPWDADTVGRLAQRLAALVAERGLPRPARAATADSTTGMPEAEMARLTDRVAGAGEEPRLAEAVRQLIKACFYPEKDQCCESYREVSADGTCRRQELARVRGRISGSYCVDCPHWTALTPAEQAQRLAEGWRAEPAMLTAHEDVFLPADFRALRRALYAAARR